MPAEMKRVNFVSLKACLNSNPAAFDKLIFGLEEIDTISALVTVRKHSFSREAAGWSPRRI
jgi:hypothetical protein